MKENMLIFKFERFIIRHLALKVIILLCVHSYVLLKTEICTQIDIVPCYVDRDLLFLLQMIHVYIRTKWKTFKVC